MDELVYREEILEHWRNPLNFGEMEKPDLVVEQVNPLCGDEVTFYFRLSVLKNTSKVGSPRRFTLKGSDSFEVKRRKSENRKQKTDNRIIKEVSFTGSGCAISMASASMLSEAIKGKSISKLSEITGQDVLGLIGGPVAPARLKCAFLALEAVRKLII